MSSQSTSKWAANNEDTVAALELRKREKEAKRRLREEKARRAAGDASITVSSSLSTSQVKDGETQRPTKRQRRSPLQEENGTSTQEEGENLLQFPTRQFGPCGHVDQYELLNDIEEGSYGFVSRGRTKSSGEIVALKRLKMKQTTDGFPVTGLREIQTLMACRHTNVVKLLGVVMGDSLKE